MKSKYARMRGALVLAHEIERWLRDYPENLITPTVRAMLTEFREKVKSVLGDYSYADAEKWKNDLYED